MTQGSGVRCSATSVQDVGSRLLPQCRRRWPPSSSAARHPGCPACRVHGRPATGESRGVSAAGGATQSRSSRVPAGSRVGGRCGVLLLVICSLSVQDTDPGGHGGCELPSRGLSALPSCNFRRWDPEAARGEEAETISAQLPQGENVFSFHVWLNGERTLGMPWGTGKRVDGPVQGAIAKLWRSRASVVDGCRTGRMRGLEWWRALGLSG